ncbi:MAG: 4Fe-4S dicluster domain-containing protein [Promethearchaeota archaeon]
MEISISAEAKAFREKIQELSGQDLSMCFQCGECSAGCPTADKMDYYPSKLIRLAQLGQKEILESETIWLCTSCFTCFVRCPRQIDIAKVAEALRQIKLRKNIDKVDLNKLSAEERRRLPQIAIVSSLRKLSA